MATCLATALVLDARNGAVRWSRQFEKLFETQGSERGAMGGIMGRGESDPLALASALFALQCAASEAGDDGLVVLRVPGERAVFAHHEHGMIGFAVFVEKGGRVDDKIGRLVAQRCVGVATEGRSTSTNAKTSKKGASASVASSTSAAALVLPALAEAGPVLWARAFSERASVRAQPRGWCLCGGPPVRPAEDAVTLGEEVETQSLELLHQASNRRVVVATSPSGLEADWLVKMQPLVDVFLLDGNDGASNP